MSALGLRDKSNNLTHISLQISPENGSPLWNDDRHLIAKGDLDPRR
jgi:hypothetical protein